MSTHEAWVNGRGCCPPHCFGCYRARSAGGRCPRRSPRKARRKPYSNPWTDAMKRPDAAKQTPDAIGLTDDAKFVAAFPRVHEFLTCDKWDDGKSRVTGSLSLFIEQGVWKACLNDRDTEASLYVTGETTLACMKALEGRLDGTKEADWRAWKKKGKR